MSSGNDITPETIQAYILGTLAPDAAEELRSAATANPEIAAEIALWQNAHDIHADKVDAAQPGEFGWARIEREIARSAAAARIGGGTIQASGPAIAANVAANDEPIWSARRFAGWQVAACVAVAILGWQTLVVPVVTPTTLDDPAAYTLAGDPSQSQFTLRIAIADGVSETDMREALVAIDATIVEGPSAIGLYTLGFSDAEALAAARNELEQRGDIFAEIAE